jgi:hypothetical protein
MKIAYGALLGSALAAALIAPACAQTAVPMPAAATAVVAGASDTSVLRVGTEVALKMSEELTTNGKKLRVGQRFRMEVAEPVMVGGNVVIPPGSPATGEVTEVRNKGMWGKSGAINARVLYVQVNGRQIRLSGSLDDKGKTGTAGVVAAVALLPVAGFFTTGTSAVIPIGAPVKAFIDEDVPVSFASGSEPTPLTVPVAPPAAAPAAPATPSSGN